MDRRLAGCGLTHTSDPSAPVCTTLISLRKKEYRCPISANDQDLTTYGALAEAAGITSVEIIVKSRDRQPHRDSHGRVQVHFVPLRLPRPLDLVEFAVRGGLIARRLSRTDAIVECPEPLGGGLALLLATSFTPLPRIAHLQGELLALPPSAGRLRSLAMRRLARHVLRRATVVRCVSRPVLEQAAAAGIDRRRLKLLLPRCDTSLFDPTRLEPRDGGTGHVPTVVFAGSLTVQKGVSYLLRAVASMVREHRPVRCLIYGDGPEEASLRSLASRLGLTDEVQFVGRLDHHLVPAAMSAGDVLALPSLTEGTPRVVLEAMAVGLPVVATSVGGLPDIFCSDAGLLVPPGDESALAEAIATILDDPKARERSRSLRDVIVAEVGATAGIEQYLALLRAAKRYQQRPELLRG